MIKIGVSACLLGLNVRYDGKNKGIELNEFFDPDIFQLTGICPEVEMGLTVPRPPIELINHGSIKLVQVDDHSIDFTNQMNTWFQENYQNISQFSGFILKSKSPSCGNQTTPHYFKNKIEVSDGYFVRQLKKYMPNILIIDETGLKNQKLKNKFLKNFPLKNPIFNN